MREPCTEATPSSSAVITAVMNGSASVAAATHALTSITTANSDAASPRKKPRKQNVVATEDKYGSNVNMEPDSPVSEEKTVKTEEADEDLKFILMKRPRISIVANYKINTKAAHNHFQRYSDVKAKEERKPSIQEIASQKGVVQRANGWRIQHIAGQIDELITAEQEVLKKMGEFREKIPKVKPGQKTKFQDDLVMLNELLQGNIQRSQLVVEQLGDSRKSMVKVSILFANFRTLPACKAKCELLRQILYVLYFEKPIPK
ncbi:PREDICTED: histone deacetylase complex subunit SAP130-like [Acropora digitifera]|uniref:histone deacetylase complex subunit SAP130-like n=1 Tax=Acropora digitifera TaxID=70779 RepID=UPI00077B26CA|nr:PREDICTED: histone deacetylase complex subunit SAP130-like [Acropora digitifera]